MKRPIVGSSPTAPTKTGVYANGKAGKKFVFACSLNSWVAKFDSESSALNRLKQSASLWRPTNFFYGRRVWVRVPRNTLDRLTPTIQELRVQVPNVHQLWIRSSIARAIGSYPKGCGCKSHRVHHISVVLGYRFISC